MRHSAVCILAILIVFSLFIEGVQAQVRGDTIVIAATYTVADTGVEFGDIISYDVSTGRYVLSREPDDQTVFGIAVQDPVIVYRTNTDEIPIVETGRANINVTNVNGSIVPGDFITSSAIPGKGQKAGDTDTYIIGIAQAALTPESATGTLIFNDEEVLVGSIPVFLSIGPRPDPDAAELPDGSAPEVTILNIIQYIVAGFVAVGSVYISFRNFMPNVRAGVVAVGRNPRAKSSIQAMVAFNLFLIIAVSSAGLLISIAIILIPI